MSYTPVQNRFWSDGWVRGINALDRYLFLYLLTNGRANLTGIYELPLDLMAAESGIDEKDLRLSMLTRLEPKIYYKEGWVILRNYLKHRVSSSPQYLKGIENEFNNLPPHIREIALSLGYPIDTVSIPSRIRIDKNRIDKNIIEPPVREDDSSGKEEIQERPDTDREIDRLGRSRKKAERIVAWYWRRKGFDFENPVQMAQQFGRDMKAASQMAKADYTVDSVEEVAKYCDKNYERWTLETIGKVYHEVV